MITLNHIKQNKNAQMKNNYLAVSEKQQKALEAFSMNQPNPKSYNSKNTILFVQSKPKNI